MRTLDSLPISQMEKPSQAQALSTVERTSQKRDEENLSDLSIAHADLEEVREKSPPPEFDIHKEYFDVVG